MEWALLSGRMWLSVPEGSVPIMLFTGLEPGAARPAGAEEQRVWRTGCMPACMLGHLYLHEEPDSQELAVASAVQSPAFSARFVFPR